MKDRFINGFIAGVIGGIVGVTGGVISKALGISEMTAVEFTALLLFGRDIMMTSEFIWATIAGVMFTGVFGIIFAHIILIIKSKYLYIKGAIYGFVTWYLWYSMILNTFTEMVDVITLQTSISNATNAMFYGIILSITYKYLHEKELVGKDEEAGEDEKNEFTKSLPASKYTLAKGQPQKLRQPGKINLFGKLINIILRRKKIR